MYRLLLIVAVLVAGSSAPAAAADSADDCARPAAFGDLSVDVRFLGQVYPGLVHVRPGVAADARVPSVLTLHGRSGNGPRQMAYSGLRPVAEENGCIVGAPDGAIVLPQNPMPPGGSWAWNVPGVPTTAGQMPPPDARDDV